MTYYKVLRKDDEGNLVSCHGGTHTWEPGVTYGPVTVEPCRSGFHACRAEDLLVWLDGPGTEIHEIELDDVIVMLEKVVGSTATLGRYVGSFSRLDFVRVAIFAAQQVAHLNSDPRVRAAIETAKAVVEGTGEVTALWASVEAAAAAAATVDPGKSVFTGAWAAYAASDAAAAAYAYRHAPACQVTLPGGSGVGRAARSACDKAVRAATGLDMRDRIADLRGRIAEYVLSLADQAGQRR